MELAFSGARADGADGDQVGEVLRRDGVEHLTGDGHSHVSEVDEHLSRHAQALVDPERVVHVRVVDESLPADGGPGLLEVRAHHDEEVVLVLLLFLEQPAAVVHGHLRIVDGAGAYDDE